MTRSPLFNYTLALFCGIALGAAGAVHVLTSRVEAANRAATAANEQRIQELQKTWQEQLAADQEKETALEQRAARCEETASRRANADAFNAQWYTLLYEPQEAAANPTASGVLSLVDPRLGKILTALENSQGQRAGKQVTLRWILPGTVLPIAAPAGSTTGVYTAEELPTAQRVLPAPRPGYSYPELAQKPVVNPQ